MFLNILTETVSEITPTRNLNILYIIFDIVFLIIFICLLLRKKRYMTILFALFGGILYTIVDYGGFYLMSGTRTVFINGEIASSLNTFWVLLWMSMSYGITNFAFIWVLISKDKLAKYRIFLIVIWRLIAPSISQLGGEATIQTVRTTGAYHGYMGIALVVGYLLLICFYFYKGDKNYLNILHLFAIGFFVQFGREFSLLINGIRPMNSMSIQTLLVNSCLETNLGIPYIYFIYLFVTKYFTEDLKKIKKA